MGKVYDFQYVKPLSRTYLLKTRTSLFVIFMAVSLEQQIEEDETTEVVKRGREEK